MEKWPKKSDIIYAWSLKPWFQFEVFFFWEDENDWLLKFWFLKTCEAPINPILKIQQFPLSMLIHYNLYEN